QKAAQIDNGNAEVFLLLGRAHYQLGALDEAIAAWRKTLALAPEEPLAKRMLAALGAQKIDVDLRIKLNAAMRDQRLFHPGLDECKKVLAEEAVSDAQRAAVMMLQAHMALESQGPAESWKIVQQLLTLYPEHADPIETTLVLGQAKLRTGGEATADGLALLQKIVADHGATPAAATAQYELASFDLEQEVLPARVDALAAWLAANTDHRLAPSASRKLIDSYLVLTVASGPPQDDTPLSAQDKKALALTVALYGATPTAGETQTLSAQWAKHFTSHYSSRGAHTASIEGVGTLLGAKLPRADRVLMLRALAGSQRAVAGRQLGRQSLAGELAAADPTKVPAALTAVSATLDTIAKEFPAENIWKDRMELAGLARSYASAVPLPVEVRRLKAPDAWAIELALPMIQADADAATVKQAVEMVQAVIADYASLEATEARELTLGVSRRLVAAVAVENSLWLGVLSRHAALLDAHARYLFAENTKHGQDAENAKLSDIQKEFLEVLARQVTHYAAQAPSTLPLLGIHLGPWIAAGHWTVAQQAYTTLGKSLPAAQQRRATLAIVGLWLRQVEAEHSRLIAAGLTVPRQLDPVHLKVLQQCYALQGETGDDLAQLNAIRQLWLRTVTHYANLEYFELAEQAAAVKGDPAVEAADEFAELQLARLQEQAARRQLDVFLKQYNATEKLALSPEFTAAITAYRKLITDRPTSPLVAQAVAQVFGVAALFEAHGAHVVAAGVYRDFAEFAAGIDVLSQSGPSTTSTAERAILAAAGALDARARTALTKSRADRAEDDPPPEELSAEFAAAITAYRQFVETHPDSPLLGQTIGRIMAVALKYAEIDAWEVADGVYADLLASKLAVRRPERLAFARALCVLGPAMPDHARQMLSALTAGGLRDSAESGSPTMLAGITSRNGLDLGVELNGDMGGGGMGGMGMGGGQFAGNRFGSARQPNAPATPPGATATPADEPAEPQPVAAEAASGGLIVTTLPERRPEADRDQQLLAMLRTQEANRASQVAQLREDAFAYRIVQNDSEQQGQQAPMQQRQQAIAVVLSDAELERQEKVLTAAYDAFAAIRKTYPETITAEQARGEILAMVGHWRGVSQWQRAAALGERFLVDNPTDTQLSKLRLEIARDWLAWASKPIKRKPSKQEMLTEVSQRFAQARKELD
ncbi:MAG: hypothetical protein HQ581_26830, partial [Planctomycetes bacterium]|nr:hypothetical protein [Planctomycetota bacterium]